MGMENADKRAQSRFRAFGRHDRPRAGRFAGKKAIQCPPSSRSLCARHARREGPRRGRVQTSTAPLPVRGVCAFRLPRMLQPRDDWVHDAGC